jgi:mevalonate kinase
MMISTSASAKVILFGEHAVVYKQPAIAVPVSSLRVHVMAEPSHEFQIYAENIQTTFTLQNSDHPFVQLAIQLCEQNGLTLPHATFKVNSAIPIASGLGSGASIATALARAIYAYLDLEYTQENLNALVYEIEKHYHGTPSGIDNTVIVYEKPIYFIRETPIQIINKFSPFHLVIANTGIAAPTKESVGDVRKLYESNPTHYQAIFDEIGAIAKQAFAIMQTTNWQLFGQLMNQNHALLQKLTVSCKELDILVEVALSAGALGAKLSGGGRGGNMIALVNAENAPAVIEQLLASGATHAFMTEVKI